MDSFAWSFLIVKLFYFLQYRIFVGSVNCVQHLFRTYGSLGNTWAFLILSLPLLIISPSLWLKHVHPGFITCWQVRNNPTITAFVCFHKFPGTFKALCLLLLSEQMRYPPSANLSQVQTLFQNCLHTAFWYASTTNYIFDRQSRILFDHNLYSSDVRLSNRGFWPSRKGIILNRKFPSFKSFNPPKNCAHWNGQWSIYTTQFIKYLLWIDIKPNAAFNIATNFSLLVHVPMTSKLVRVYDCIYFNLK